MMVAVGSNDCGGGGEECISKKRFRLDSVLPSICFFFFLFFFWVSRFLFVENQMME